MARRGLKFKSVESRAHIGSGCECASVRPVCARTYDEGVRERKRERRRRIPLALPRGSPPKPSTVKTAMASLKCSAEQEKRRHQYRIPGTLAIDLSRALFFVSFFLAYFAPVFKALFLSLYYYCYCRLLSSIAPQNRHYQGTISVSGGAPGNWLCTWRTGKTRSKLTK